MSLAGKLRGRFFRRNRDASLAPAAPFAFDEYQEMAARSAIYDTSKGPALLYVTGKLAFEAAEASQVALKKVYHNSPRSEAEADRILRKELGDALWYLSESCRVKGWKLSDVARENIVKLAGRGSRGALRGSGDDR